eukprot:TRINITY_DN258_c0_g1_i1.p1 TRINITY_DN258_c0_g1~~TRINITY_DN258_c0_g1_i1.p1  ORF type:complete len:292 (+),score=36.97 TRINITY_DN258_c0_g1_i1:144-1019(+)
MTLTAESFCADLRLRLSGQKPIIQQFTTIAKEQAGYHQHILKGLIHYMRTSAPQQQLYAWYLLDSIVKTVRRPYLTDIEPLLVKLAEECMPYKTPQHVPKLLKLIQTWVPLYPEATIKGLLQLLQNAENNPPQPDTSNSTPRGPPPAYSPPGLPPAYTPPNSSLPPLPTEILRSFTPPPDATPVPMQPTPEVNPFVELQEDVDDAYNLLWKCRQGEGEQQYLCEVLLVALTLRDNKTQNNAVQQVMNDMVKLLIDTAVCCGEVKLAREVICQFNMTAQYNYTTLRLNHQKA